MTKSNYKKRKEIRRKRKERERDREREEKKKGGKKNGNYTYGVMRNGFVLSLFQW